MSLLSRLNVNAWSHCDMFIIIILGETSEYPVKPLMMKVNQARDRIDSHSLNSASYNDGRTMLATTSNIF